jgi:hypothetical protein
MHVVYTPKYQALKRNIGKLAGKDLRYATFELLAFCYKNPKFGRVESLRWRISCNALSSWRYTTIERIRDFTEANNRVVSFGWKHLEWVSG